VEKSNKVFIATSLDGYIADKNGGIDWLHSIPNPENSDMGYTAFMSGIDALIMGRKTFETVCGFDMDWPYDKPVFVLSNTIKEIPPAYQEKAFLVHGSLKEVLSQFHKKGFYKFYIDGGVTIQNFLKEDLIDEMVITTIPILLGDGFPLFSSLPNLLQFELIKTAVFSKDIVQVHYRRKSS
jgi:dihydrofolate reductase